MLKFRLGAILILLAGIALGYFVFWANATDARPFKFGLDLTGGTHLVYQADTSAIAAPEVDEAMQALRDVIERRINIFGVSEPIVQVEGASVLAGGDATERLIVELPGVTDVQEAIELIGKTPLLEFELVADPAATSSESRYAVTGLTGRYVTRAQLEFMAPPTGGVPTEPVVTLTFNSEGAALFEQITSEHVGEQLAIFLDGVSISEPVINEPIAGGTAVISGNFAPEEARQLVRDLNIGALPVPIELLSTQSIGASLGADTLNKGIVAGMYGLGIVALFMILWYRLPGLVAVVALSFYVAIMLGLFELIPVTLTAAGLAGFILSIGMAVDANVLIFERTKEELLAGKDLNAAVTDGFARAWLAIRDGNATSVLSAVILYWFGTSIVQGFALVFGIGVLISMFTAIVISRTLLLALASILPRDRLILLYLSGFNTLKNHRNR